MRKYRVGIAGYGVIGKRRRHFIDSDPRLRTEAVCDIQFAQSGTFPDGVRFYPTYEELLENELLDVLFVCMPNDMASIVTLAGLERDLHIFCEKPPGRTVADIEAVRAAEARKPWLKLKYGFNHRYHYSVIDAIRILRQGTLGRVINMRGVYGKSAFIPWPRPQASGSAKDDIKVWRTSRAIAGGGILLDQGIHMVDLMLQFGGDFSEVKSFVSNGYWRHDVEDNAYALLRSKDGIVAMLHSTATQWRHRFQLEISLTEGGITLAGILSGTKSYGSESLTVSYREDEANGNPREQMTTYIRDDSWKLEIDEFVHSLVEDQPIQNGTSLDALRSMQLVHRIYGADTSWADALAKADQAR